jgi:hypothetical protein
MVKVHAVVDSTGTVSAIRIESPTASKSEDSQIEHSSNELNEVTSKVDVISADAWTINGQVYMVSPQTEIKGNIFVGDVVKIHFNTNPDGTLAAAEIEKAGDNQAHNSVENGQNSNGTEFTGVVESINSDNWVIAGKTFAVTSQTEIKGAIAIGDPVKVHVFTASDGTMTVSEIELAAGAINSGNSGNGMSADDMKLTGILEQIGLDQYVIGGQVVLITPQTILDSNLVIGSMVKVELIVNPDGTLTAKEIETINGSKSDGNQGNSKSGNNNSGNLNNVSNSGNSGGSSSNDDHGNNSGSDSGNEKDDSHNNDDGPEHD